MLNGSSALLHLAEHFSGRAAVKFPSQELELSEKWASK